MQHTVCRPEIGRQKHHFAARLAGKNWTMQLQAEEMKQLIEDSCQNIDLEIFAQMIFLNTTFVFSFESHFVGMCRMQLACTCV